MLATRSARFEIATDSHLQIECEAVKREIDMPIWQKRRGQERA
jgi:hypothetical protein